MTQRIQNQYDQLKAVNRGLKAFAFSAAHDLRKPLHHINGYVNLLLKREQGKLDEKSRHYLRVISKSALNMNQLISDLLILSYADKAEIKKEHINMDTLVNEVQNELTTDEASRRLVWSIHSLPDALGNANLLQQVWKNLISNAVKFTSTIENVHIEIGILTKSNLKKNKQEKDVTTYFIRDNGVGFDPVHLNKLFQPFQRLHGENEFPGNGIGLSIVKRIIDRHGGKVWAESRPNRCTSFYFTLKKTKAT